MVSYVSQGRKGKYLSIKQDKQPGMVSVLTATWVLTVYPHVCSMLGKHCTNSAPLLTFPLCWASLFTHMCEGVKISVYYILLCIWLYVMYMNIYIHTYIYIYIYMYICFITWVLLIHLANLSINKYQVLCVYKCRCVLHTCEHIYVDTCSCMWRPGVEVVSYPPLLSTHAIEAGSFNQTQSSLIWPLLLALGSPVTSFSVWI